MNWPQFTSVSVLKTATAIAVLIAAFRTGLFIDRASVFELLIVLFAGGPLLAWAIGLLPSRFMAD